MSCKLTDETAHTGKFSAVFWDTQYAAISEGIPAAKPGESYKLSLWVKHNDPKGSYWLKVIPWGKNGGLAESGAAIPWKPNEWQQVEIYFTTPRIPPTCGFSSTRPTSRPARRCGWTISSSEVLGLTWATPLKEGRRSCDASWLLRD